MTFNFINNAGTALVGVHLKSCSKNMQQTSKKTPMPKYDVNEVAKHY